MRQEGKLARLRLGHAEIGVDPERRHPDAEAIRADDAEAGRPRRVEHPLAELEAKPGGNDHRSTRALLPKCRDQARNGVWRRGDDGEVRRLRQLVYALEAVLPGNPPAFWIDEIDWPCESATKENLRELLAHRAAVVARTDHRDRAWTQGIFKIANGHWRFELAIEAVGFNEITDGISIGPLKP